MNGRDSSISRNTPFLIFSLLGERASGEAASKLGHFPGTFAVSRSGCAYQEIPGWKGKAKGNLEVTDPCGGLLFARGWKQRMDP